MMDSSELEYQRSVVAALTARLTVLPTTVRGGRATAPPAKRIRLAWKQFATA
jgi:hypothetical protein